MSILKVQKIRHTASNTDVVDIASDGTCRANIVNNLSNKNIVINGAMQVAQRGTSSTLEGFRTVDRFNTVQSGVDEGPTREQADVAAGTTPYTLGFRKCFKMTNGNQTNVGVTDTIKIEYKFEAQDLANSGWDYTSNSSYITLSFWVKSSVPQSFKFSFITWDGSAKMYPMDTGSLSADTWTKITKTIPGASGISIDNDNNLGAQINFFQYLGTSYTNNSVTENAWATYGNPQTKVQTDTWYDTNDATFEITGVQLEVGSVATDFEHRSFAQELALCQRYYLDFLSHDGQGTNPISNFSFAVGTWYNSTNIFCPIRFPVAMRTAPSMESSNNTNDFYALYGVHFQYYNQNVLSGASNLGARIRPNVTANQGSSGTCTVLHVELAASAQLRFNAEL